mmetsp:Transcript_48200/g.145604  ORF Transcript_48200/g.145604 Transcript_48200/m.145604 type:complete len:634 (-) Transcript_48200:244-2145(-)|eukprot:CAMPEP_0113540396 /NCGR_PEP_ID=MMETSP0015_2-20120614/8456_1 /TAXON_ID=2838 /ORGANISM="Odontella" /LENGTH=633 /DNA_ID=CAMNT_0000440193 /DNA_START=239 /DNA_END=2140 /DNA_ORIENTATION=+ /assembly_acc=CAM_ASM_000160
MTTARTVSRRAARRQLASASALAIVVLAATAPSASADENAKCTDSLKCRHGAECTDGNANYGALNDFPTLPFLDERSRDGKHCKCPDGRTGVDCGTKFEVCDEDSGFSCLDNGICEKTQKGSPVCDCSTAHKDGEVLFAGSHCEFVATAVCDAEDDGLETEMWFCANKGTCRKSSNINEKCNCPDDWFGPHCEFPKGHHHANAENCDLKCENGGQCKFGTKTHQDVSGVADHFEWGKEVFGMHCVCPRGYAGLTCNVQVEKCGDVRCFRGSKCIEDGDKKGHCDCTAAKSKDNTRYAGRYCEHGSTTVCEREGVVQAAPGKTNGSTMFCTNGGKCNTEEPHKGCECSGTGHEGPLCEYKGGTEPDCTLNCKNGGQCRHGINPNVAGILGTKFDLSIKAHSGFMHCSCPDGFIGADCSVGYEICGPEEEMQHLCANGGKCIRTGTDSEGKGKYACNCGVRNPFAGQHCEHPATVFCAKSEEGEKNSYHSFCTHGGKCKEHITPTESHPGCECPDDWEGDHCQYRFGTTPVEEVTAILKEESSEYANGANAKSPEGGGGKAVGFAVAITVLAVLSLVGVFVHTRMRRMANANGANAKNVNIAPKGSHDQFDAEDKRPGSKMSVNLDGQMHDVEII